MPRISPSSSATSKSRSRLPSAATSRDTSARERRGPASRGRPEPCPTSVRRHARPRAVRRCQPPQQARRGDSEAADRRRVLVDVVGPSASASYASGDQGLSPSSAPLEPSGSAGPSAGSPASFSSGSVSGGSRSVVGSGVPASPSSPLVTIPSPPAPACRARQHAAAPAG